jgi:hypothetical protein
VGGFYNGNYNSDGLIGRNLKSIGRTLFHYDMTYLISARRYNRLGFMKFTRQFIYVFENFFPSLRGNAFFKRLGYSSMIQHRATGQRSGGGVPPELTSGNSARDSKGDSV